MTTSMILPPATPKPAEIAAPPAAESANAAATEGGPSFGKVLESQINKSGKEAKGEKSDADGEGEAKDASDAVAEAAAPADGTNTLMNILATAAEARPVMAEGLVQSVQPKDPRIQAAPAAADTKAVDEAVGTLRGSDHDARPTAGVRLRADDADRAANDADRTFRIEPAADEVRAVSPRASRSESDGTDTKVVGAAATNPSSVATPVHLPEQRRVAEAAPLRLTVAQPVASQGWGEAVADRVTWVTQARQPSAEIQLNPPNLGPVEVRVSMNGDQANVSFFSAHAPVREALQSALPRLTEAFAASGLSLGDVSVGADARSGQDQGRQQGRQGRRDDDDGAIGRVSAPSARWSSAVGGMRAVDLFA